ncbi:hypothetical protein J3Q64DRAFT_1698038 [Phycomyces blakesleeanus]|uniref:Uncharacterized protein n=2 Tax=Phycomyces blakesleeanus TaxID=4837 RepID=A0A167LST2_PHYB8|nr:hypothetical protein PHYBLDRAFT_171080 [Phycomyces blakesleeanus NRRL 1555(-)]OAD71019.1 hypothetical protein PHYBLDRAFT_171080 [Phycomyces blakesleeanus NRRL 1555(-)]|eukprot:XP_018289059.1 hypothetical protein PHYBLDRAFT_171080 [Phycomyces blakesleeanus NRRL 1555(-)]
MSYFVNHPDDRGVSHIPVTMTQARVDFIPTRTNKTPSATFRINALINFLWKKQRGTDFNVSAEEQKLIRLQFHMYTRQCRRIMREDGILETNWGKLSSQQKLYYSLRLEELILNYQFALHKCRGQRAATLLLQEMMKAEHQTENREVQEEELSLGGAESSVAFSPPRRNMWSRRI